MEGAFVILIAFAALCASLCLSCGIANLGAKGEGSSWPLGGDYLGQCDWARFKIASLGLGASCASTKKTITLGTEDYYWVDKDSCWGERARDGPSAKRTVHICCVLSFDIFCARDSRKSFQSFRKRGKRGVDAVAF